ncbi:hypothetical protein OHC33_006469 [Knufia fluminis]|uniref:Uncharacterized protein n=1 Tax=Knufia fluminis TaxID=191047 RepID=A0AAN8ES22_9EURO|nr:hypothetical protein OHC33_006469 [Knufia fluminis]
MKAKKEDGRQVRHFIRKSASDFARVFITMRNAARDYYVQTSPSSKPTNDDPWSPMQSASPLPDRYWSYHGESDESPTCRSLDDSSGNEDASPGSKPPVTRSQIFEPSPLAPISEVSIGSAARDSITTSSGEAFAHSNDTTLSGYQASVSSSASSGCHRTHILEKQFLPDILQLKTEVCTLTRQAASLEGHLVAYTDDYPEELRDELSRLVDLLEEVWTVTRRVDFHLRLWGRETKEKRDKFIKNNPIDPLYSTASRSRRVYPRIVATSTIARRMKNKAMRTKSKLATKRTRAEWKVLESMRAATNTTDPSWWDVLPLAVLKSCEARYRKIAKSNGERMEID